MTTIFEWAHSKLDNVRITADGDDIQANCPFCEYDANQHLYINLHEKIYHCFKCESRGTWIDLIRKIDGCSFTDALMIVQSPSYSSADYDTKIHEFMQEQHSKSISNEKAKLPEGFTYLHNPSADTNYIARLAIRYLKHRNVPYEFIYEYNLFGVAPKMMRVFIMTSEHYWQARALTNLDTIKYMNPNVEVGGTLGLYDHPIFGEYIKSLSDTLYVTEGVFSALALIKNNIAACSIFGKNIRPLQYKRLLELNVPLVLMLDYDAIPLAWEQAKKFYDDGKRDIYVAELAEGDPDTCNTYLITEMSLDSYTNYKMR